MSLQAKIMFSFLEGCRVCLQLLNVEIFKDNKENMDKICHHILEEFGYFIFHSGNNAACMICLDGVTRDHCSVLM